MSGKSSKKQKISEKKDEKKDEERRESKRSVIDAVFLIIKGFNSHIEQLRFRMNTFQKYIKKVDGKIDKLKFDMNNMTGIWSDDAKKLENVVKSIRERLLNAKESDNLEKFCLEIASLLENIIYKDVTEKSEKNLD